MYINLIYAFVILCSASLVPVFSFGENELFNQVNNPRGSKLRNIQTRLQKILSFAPPLFFGRGILSNVIGFQPHKTPIFTVGMYKSYVIIGKTFLFL